MSYKFQIGSAALSGAVIQKLGTALNSQYVLQNDAGTAKIILKASTGGISGSYIEAVTGSFSGRLTASSLQLSGLTSGRVPFATTSGVLTDDSDFTFATDTLTITKLGAYEQAGAVDFSDEAMTNVNIDSGAIDGTAIGANSHTTGKFTTVDATTDLTVDGLVLTADTITNDAALTVVSTGFTVNASLDIALSADGGNVTMDDGTTTVFDFNTDDPELKIMDDAQVANYCSIAVGANGATTMTTVDADAAAANLIITADGTVDIDSAGLMTLDSGAGIALEPAAGSAVLIDGAASFDGDQLTGLASVTSTAFVGTLSTAAQPNITSLGTIASLVATTADINAGTVDAVIGGTTPAAGSFTTLSASSTLSAAGAVQLDGADDGVAFVAADNMYFRDAGTGQMRRDSWSDVMDVAVGTVTTTGLDNSSGVIGLAIHSLNAEVIATGDFLAFSDVGDNGLHKESVDDLFTKGPALATEAVFAVADDYINFLDGGASGDAKKEKWADIAALIAGDGITATNGVLSTEGGSTTPNALEHGETMAEGYNYVTGTRNASVFLPQGATLGDMIRLKAQALGNGKAVTISSKAGSSTTIDGETSVALRSQYGAVMFIYTVSGSWLVA